MRKENLLGDTERKCLENEEIRKYLNQQRNMCMTRRGQLERMPCYQI